MSRGEGSGWHRESRRHSEAAKIGRPTHAQIGSSGKKAPKEVVPSAPLRKAMEDYISSHKHDFLVATDNLKKYDEGELDYDDRIDGMDYDGWVTVRNNAEGRVSGMEQVLNGMDKNIKQDVRRQKALLQIYENGWRKEGNRLEKEADQAFSPDDMHFSICDRETHDAKYHAYETFEGWLKSGKPSWGAK